jgi:hypothetical protein
MHDRDNPELIGLFRVNDAIWEPSAEMAANRRIKFSECLGMLGNLTKESFDLTKKPFTQFLINGGVVGHTLAELGVSFRMKNAPHRER